MKFFPVLDEEYNDDIDIKITLTRIKATGDNYKNLVNANTRIKAIGDNYQNLVKC